MEEIIDPVIYFKSSNGLIVGIKLSDLQKFPDSYIAVLAKYVGWSDHVRSCFSVPFDDHTLDLVAGFYANGIWSTPYLAENVMHIEGVDVQGIEVDGVEAIDEVMRRFEVQCLFLGLPCDFEEPEDEDVAIETSSQDDDFYPYNESEDDYQDYECGEDW